jgi:hypothetical protein
MVLLWGFVVDLYSASMNEVVVFCLLIWVRVLLILVLVSTTRLCWPVSDCLRFPGKVLSSGLYFGFRDCPDPASPAGSYPYLATLTWYAQKVGPASYPPPSVMEFFLVL